MDLIIYIIPLICLSAFFSGSETAFISIGNIRKKQLESINDISSKRVLTLLEDPHKLVITIVISNTIVNIASSSLAGQYFYDMFGEKGMIISVLLMTPILIIFGEVTPKLLAFSSSMEYALVAALPIAIIEKIILPLRIVLEKIIRKMMMFLGIELSIKPELITENVIIRAFKEGRKQGVVKEKEKQMIYGALGLKNSNAADIMTPRLEIKAIDISSSKDQMIDIIKENKYSRLPVFIHNMDNIIGIIHVKDILVRDFLNINEIVKKPYFVPESIKVDELLKYMQKERSHIAIVADEYGTTSGVLTIEDILEEIVGEISDEYDFDDEKIKMIDKKTFEVDGQVHLNDIEEKLSLGIVTDEVDTIAGYVILLLGKIPQSDDFLENDNYRITVLDVSKNRITRLKIEKKAIN